jgi:hypothetical protein
MSENLEIKKIVRVADTTLASQIEDILIYQTENIEIILYIKENARTKQIANTLKGNLKVWAEDDPESILIDKTVDITEGSSGKVSFNLISEDTNLEVGSYKIGIFVINTYAVENVVGLYGDIEVFYSPYSTNYDIVVGSPVIEIDLIGDATPTLYRNRQHEFNIIGNVTSINPTGLTNGSLIWFFVNNEDGYTVNTSGLIEFGGLNLDNFGEDQGWGVIGKRKDIYYAGIKAEDI